MESVYRCMGYRDPTDMKYLVARGYDYPVHYNTPGDGSIRTLYAAEWLLNEGIFPIHRSVLGNTNGFSYRCWNDDSVDTSIPEILLWYIGPEELDDTMWEIQLVNAVFDRSITEITILLANGVKFNPAWCSDIYMEFTDKENPTEPELLLLLYGFDPYDPVMLRYPIRISSTSPDRYTAWGTLEVTPRGQVYKRL